jgi:dynein heavy chain, axonemal
MRRDNIVADQEKKKLMNEMLESLLNSGDDILESDDLVEKLELSSKTTIEITARLENAKNIEKKIDDSRKIFKPVANQGARLYFALQDISVLDPMYRYSMNWFQDLFLRPFQEREAEAAEPEDVKHSESATKNTDRPGGATGRDLDASFVS